MSYPAPPASAPASAAPAPENLPELTPELYNHLRSLAERIFAERGATSVEPTALLQEAWLRVSRAGSQYASRAHFMMVAARAMRQILVDQARKRAERGGVGPDATVTWAPSTAGEPVGVLALDASLAELETLDPEAARVVQLRVFGGLSVAEVAALSGTSPRAVDRTWRFARAFLARSLPPSAAVAG